MKSNHTMGHLASLLTIIIWGTTFISTKILLVDPVYDPDTVPIRLQAGTGPVCKPGLSVQYHFLRLGRIGSLLCHLEFCGQSAGRGQNKHLHLYGSCDYSGDFGSYPP